ncbi:MAG: hypothetical protein ACLU2L_00865 [Fenollaria timonensis]
MLFNSAGYIVFFTIVCLVYFILPKKLKRVFFLLASYFFYSCWNLKYSLLMLFSTVATYGTAIAMDMVGAKKRKSSIWDFASLSIWRYSSSLSTTALQLIL